MFLVNTYMKFCFNYSWIEGSSLFLSTVFHMSNTTSMKASHWVILRSVYRRNTFLLWVWGSRFTEEWRSRPVIWCIENGKIVINLIPLPRHSNRSLETPPLQSALYSMEKVVFWATPTWSVGKFVTLPRKGVERKMRAQKCVESSH